MPRLAALAAERAAAPEGAPRRIDLRSRQMGARGSRQWQTLLDTTTLSEEVASGKSLDAYEVRLTLSQLGSNGLLAHVDEGGAIEECDDDDNIGLWEDPPC